MSATVTFVETNEAFPGVEDITIINLNFGSDDSSDIVPATYPIVNGENSFEKYILARFSGIGTEISNMKFWKSGGAIHAEADVKFKCVAAYLEPSENAMPAGVDVPEAEPGVANITPATIATPSGDSDYTVLQLQTTVSMPCGSIDQLEWTFQYDEV